MSSSRRPFRIETTGELVVTGAFAEQAAMAGHFDRMFEELGELRAMMQRFSRELSMTRPADGLALWAEVEAIRQSIMKTKREIATLHGQGFQGEQINRVSDELDAVVSGTEGATEAILAAAETIDENIGKLMERLKGKDKDIAADIHDQAIRIFEACNFQDLTGQRISKVVAALKFIEERVASMMEIWGGAEGFADIEIPAAEAPTGDRALLHGPALAGDPDAVSQDDIDVLFA